MSKYVKYIVVAIMVSLLEVLIGFIQLYLSPPSVETLPQTTSSGTFTEYKGIKIYKLYIMKNSSNDLMIANITLYLWLENNIGRPIKLLRMYIPFYKRSIIVNKVVGTGEVYKGSFTVYQGIYNAAYFCGVKHIVKIYYSVEGKGSIQVITAIADSVPEIPICPRKFYIIGVHMTGGIAYFLINGEIVNVGDRDVILVSIDIPWFNVSIPLNNTILRVNGNYSLNTLVKLKKLLPHDISNALVEIRYRVSGEEKIRVFRFLTSIG